jgi:hypothetical protein
LAEEFYQAYTDLPPRNPPYWPRYFMLCHSIELGLKAYLAYHGTTHEQLKKQGVQHNLRGLMRNAVKAGLSQKRSDHGRHRRRDLQVKGNDGEDVEDRFLEACAKKSLEPDGKKKKADDEVPPSSPRGENCPHYPECCTAFFSARDRNGSILLKKSRNAFSRFLRKKRS